MFASETLIALAEPITIDDRRPNLGELAGNGSTFMVQTKGSEQPAIASLTVAAGEYVELATESGRKIKCGRRAKLMLPSGGFTYADESNGATVDTESGAEQITQPDVQGKTEPLVSIRLSAVHAVLANGFWFLVD